MVFKGELQLALFIWGLTLASYVIAKNLALAVAASRTLGFERPPLISAEVTISDDVLVTINHLLGQFSAVFNTAVPGYWGNSCQTLSTNIFARLNQRGIPSNIVIGNVLVNGFEAFETTLEGLQRELQAENSSTGVQHLHAWISLGDDTVVDAALPPRLVRHYNAPPEWEDRMFIGRAAALNAFYNVEYVPLLVGTEFFARTNPPDPMDLLNALKRGQRAG